MKNVVLLLLVILVTTPVRATELLNENGKQELKKAFHSQAIINGETVTGVELGIDLTSLNRLFNANGDIWIKKTKWNEIWLENLKLDYSSSSRLSLAATIRYRTYTKNFFKPSRRWRTASYKIEFKGSLAVAYDNNQLALSDFKVDLMDLKHFPGWAENAIKDYVNGKISTAIPLPFTMQGISNSDLTMTELKKDGSVVVAIFRFSEKAQFNVTQIARKIEHANATLLKGVDFAPKLISANVGLYPDKWGGKSFGIKLQFAEVPGVTNGVEVRGLLAGASRIIRSEKWYKDWSDDTARNNETAYEGVLFGGVRFSQGVSNLPPGKKIQWQARYNFSTDPKKPKPGTKWATGVLEVPDYGISVDKMGREKDYLDPPVIKEFTLVEDPKKGRQLVLRLVRPAMADYGDVLVSVQLSGRRHIFHQTPVYAKADWGKTYFADWHTITEPDNQILYYSEESLVNGFERTILTDRFYGTAVVDGKQIQAVDIPADTYNVSVTYHLKVQQLRNGKVQTTTRIGLSAHSKLVVPGHVVGAPGIKSVTSSEKGVAFSIDGQKGTAVEVEYRTPGTTWANDTDNWNQHIIRIPPSKSFTVSADKLDIYKEWEVRVRNATSEGFRSPWSGAKRVEALPKPREEKPQPAAEDASGSSTGQLLGTATSNGNGQRKKGGTLVWLPLTDLADADALGFTCKSGSCSYMTIHGRTTRGSWRTLYRGELRPQRVGDVLKGQRSGFSHLVIAVNGQHERYDRRVGAMDIFKASKTAETAVSTPPPDEKAVQTNLLGTASNDGTGRRKSGGKLVWVALSKLADNDQLSFQCKSDSCSYVTIHGRTTRGSWRTLYRGKLQRQRVGSILKGQRRNYSHLVISVNGQHERYDRRAGEMKVLQLAEK